MSQPVAVDCPECGKSVKNLSGHMRVHATPGAPPAVDVDANPYDDMPSAEKKPKERKPGWKDKLWGGAPTSPRTSRPKAKGNATGKRESATDLLGAAWSGGGWAVERFGIDVPVGRCLQFQGPMAGEILDDFLAGGVVDRVVLQRFAGKTDRWQRISALFMLPALVGAVERNPDLMGPLQPVIMFALRQNVIAMAPAIKKREEEERHYAEIVAELGLDRTATGESIDPAQAIWDSLFAAPPAPPAEDPVHTNGATAGVPVT